jgi:Family of unknown function (DUF5678)
MPTTVSDIAGLLTNIPPGAWVAISEEKNAVVAYGADAQAVFSEAQEKGEEVPLIGRVPDRATAMFL